MRRDAKMRLFDIIEAARLIKETVAGMSASAFVEADAMYRSAVYFQLTIIGEAIAKLRAEHPQIVSSISDVHRIVEFRNRIVHGYHEIDDEVVWQIITTKLDTLIAQVEQLLASL